MRFLFMILLLSAVVSCGKSGGGGSASSDPEAQQCEVNGEVVSCDSIFDGLGVDILDAKIDVPVTITASSITFNEARMDKQQGRRIACSVSVGRGESYNYTVNGNTLYLDTPEGNLTMTRVYGSGLSGKWKWKGNVDGATWTTKILTITNNQNRAFLKTSCER